MNKNRIRYRQRDFHLTEIEDQQLDWSLEKYGCGPTSIANILINYGYSFNPVDIAKKILFDKLEFNEGMIIENMVAQMLVSSGHKLYFFSNPSRLDSSSRMEIDFLIAKSKISSRHNISPIEVKSGKNYTISSLGKFIKKYKEQLYIPYVIHTADLKEEDGITYLPIYMTELL